jgi:hypothetical protein
VFISDSGKTLIEPHEAGQCRQAAQAMPQSRGALAPRKPPDARRRRQFNGILPHPCVAGGQTFAVQTFRRQSPEHFLCGGR